MLSAVGADFKHAGDPEARSIVMGRGVRVRGPEDADRRRGGVLFFVDWIEG